MRSQMYGDTRERQAQKKMNKNLISAEVLIRDHPLIVVPYNPMRLLLLLFGDISHHRHLRGCQRHFHIGEGSVSVRLKSISEMRIRFSASYSTFLLILQVASFC